MAYQAARVGNSHSLIYGGNMIEKRIRELIEDVINENNYILDEVQYVKEGSSYFLRVIVDKDGYINVDDCVKINSLIGPIIDEVDFIDGSYILDICSKEKGSISNE